jgi:hypothetical protein
MDGKVLTLGFDKQAMQNWAIIIIISLGFKAIF